MVLQAASRCGQPWPTGVASRCGRRCGQPWPTGLAARWRGGGLSGRVFGTACVPSLRTKALKWGRVISPSCCAMMLARTFFPRSRTWGEKRPGHGAILLGAMSECKVGGVRGSTRPQHLGRGLFLPV